MSEIAISVRRTHINLGNGVDHNDNGLGKLW